MEEIINLYISNITKSISIVIKCTRLITILDLKELVAKELDTYACLLRLTNGTNLEENLDALLSDLNIKNEDKLFIMNKLNVERAVLEEWYRLDGNNWEDSENWCSDLPLNEWYGVNTNENGKITDLYLDNNNLCLVPSELSQLTKLFELVLSSNNLCLVPPELSQLTNLILLDLSNNDLLSVPSELAQLTNLKYLYLYGNNLSLVPSELSQLKNLTHLYLQLNKLSSVPSELSQLKNLTIHN